MRLEINRRAAWANGPDRWNLDDADTGHRLGYIAPDHNGGWTAHVAGRDTVEGTWLEQSDALKAARRAIEAKEARFDRWLENHPGTAPDETSRPPIAFQRDIRIMASQETDDYRLVHEGWDVGSVGRDGDAWTVTDAYGRTRSHASLYEALDQAVLRADRWLEENDPQSREDRIVDEWHDWDVTTEQLESHRPTAHEIVRQNIGFQRTMRTRLDAAGMEHAIVRSIDGPTISPARIWTSGSPITTDGCPSRTTDGRSHPANRWSSAPRSERRTIGRNPWKSSSTCWTRMRGRSPKPARSPVPNRTRTSRNTSTTTRAKEDERWNMGRR